MMLRLTALLIMCAALPVRPSSAAEQRLPGAVIVDAASFIDRLAKGDTISEASLPSGPWLFNNLAVDLKSSEELVTNVQIPAERLYHLYVRSQGSGNASFKVAVLGQFAEGAFGSGPLSWKDAGEFYLPKTLADVRITSITPGSSFDVLVFSQNANLKEEDLWTSQFPSEVVMLKDYKIPAAASIKFGDLNGDGKMDFVVLTPDFSAFAFDNNGAELWHWSAPQDDASRRAEAEPPGSVWDFDQDKRAELIHWRLIDGKEWLCMADGATGEVKYKVEWPTKPLPHAYHNFQTAVARLHDGHPDGLVVYSDIGDSQTISAYGPTLKLLWTREESRSKDYFGHAIYPVDMGGDKISEIFLSHICLNASGKVIWSDADKYSDSQNYVSSMRFADLTNDGGLEMIAAQNEMGTVAYHSDTGDVTWKSPAGGSRKIEVGNFLRNAPSPQVIVSSTNSSLDASGQGTALSSVRWLAPNGRPLETWPMNPLNVDPNFVKGDWRGDEKIELFWHRFRLTADGKGELYFPEEVIHMFDFAGNGAEQVIALNKNAGILRIYGSKEARGREAKRDVDYLMNTVANHMRY